VTVQRGAPVDEHRAIAEEADVVAADVAVHEGMARQGYALLGLDEAVDRLTERGLGAQAEREEFLGLARDRRPLRAKVRFRCRERCRRRRGRDLAERREEESELARLPGDRTLVGGPVRAAEVLDEEDGALAVFRPRQQAGDEASFDAGEDLVLGA
jgi:hypothetical protein